MTNFFKAMEEFKPTPKKKFYFKDVEISLEKQLEIQHHGEENFKVENGQVVRIKRLPPEQRLSRLIRGEEGYVFYNDDPHWVTGKGKEGFTWQTKSG